MQSDFLFPEKCIDHAVSFECLQNVDEIRVVPHRKFPNEICLYVPDRQTILAIGCTQHGNNFSSKDAPWNRLMILLLPTNDRSIRKRGA